MALTANFEIPLTGASIPNAYFVIQDIETVKRITPLPYAGDNSGDPLRGETGYFCLIYMAVFSSKQARDDLRRPICFLADSMPEKPFKLCFIPDVNSTTPYLEQAYEFLKSQEYFENSSSV